MDRLANSLGIQPARLGGLEGNGFGLSKKKTVVTGFTPNE